MTIIVMRRLVGAVCAVVAAGAVLAATASAGTQGPRIQIPEERHDFGAVRQGERPSHVFQIRNAGDGLLEIQKVQTS